MRAAAVLAAVMTACALIAAPVPAVAQAAPQQPIAAPSPAPAPLDAARVGPGRPGERPAPAGSAQGGAGRLPYDPEQTRALPAPRRPPDRPNRIVYAFDRPARSLLTPSRDLSAECRRGRFIQRIDMLYRAFGPGERPLGVAYGKWAINLVDPQGRRDADTVYFFHMQDTARCAVFTAKMEEIRDWFVGP